MVYIHTCRQNTYTHKMKFLKLFVHIDVWMCIFLSECEVKGQLARAGLLLLPCGSQVIGPGGHHY